MRYRPEIDGLRALAVVPVILFHAGFPLFKGGFVGVDIFFVISGYLITSIILDELERGKFSIVTFYERRARRILPALFFVMAVCLPFSWMWLIPSEFKDFSTSLIGVILFSSNILFWQTSGYFATDVELKPLLHTWSLAVEEQYYVFFPILLLLLWRFCKRSIVWIVFGGVIGSMILAHFGATHKPIANFYLLPSRAWELGQGALVAIFFLKTDRRVPPEKFSQLMALLGFSLIIFSIFWYDKHTPFPSLYALAPTCGAVLVILYARPSTVVGSFLTLKPVVWTGLISYSAYLWHQPLFALARQRNYHELDVYAFSILSLLSLVLGYLSWRYIEAPFRNRGNIRTKHIFLFSAGGMAIFLCIGIGGVMSDGFRYRDKWKGVEGEFATQSERGSGERYCLGNHIESPLGDMVCIIGDISKKPEGVLWGDSYAAALVYGMNDELKRNGRAFYAVITDGCVPVKNAWRISLQKEFDCTKEKHNRFLKEVASIESIRNIVWIGAFSLLLDPAQSFEYVIDGQPASHEIVKDRMISMLREFEATGKKVILIGETPRFPNSVADYAIRRYAATNGDVNSGVQRVQRAEMVATLRQEDVLAEARAHARVVEGLNIFCERNLCSSHDAQGRLLFTDKSHISHLGSIRLARSVMEELNANAGDARVIFSDISNNPQGRN
jgi:peptidoglycan/LPS O-acetylase OafA/YrhL